MKTFCSSVCVNNRFPGNGGSYGTAQKRKHAARMESFPAVFTWPAAAAGGGQQLGLINYSGALQERGSVSQHFLVKLNKLIIGQMK